MTPTRLLARPMLASMFVVGGTNALRNADSLAAVAKPVTDKLAPMLQRAAPQAPIPTDAETLVRANGAVQVVGGLMLATGKAPRLAATVLTVSLVPTTIAAHRFWAETDPQAAAQQRSQFFKNVSAGGGLLLAAVDTEGKPGLLWRARHAKREAKQEAKQSRKQSRRAARQATKVSRKEAARSAKISKRQAARSAKLSKRQAMRSAKVSRRRARRASQPTHVELAVT